MLPLLRGAVAALLFVTTTATAAPDELSVATFNCEFLVVKKVHMKYGLPFDLRGKNAETWNQPGFRRQQFDKAVSVVADYVATIDADVLVLTEVGNRAEVEPLVTALADRGRDYAHWDVCDSTDRSTGQHVAVLSRRPFETVRHGGRIRIPGQAVYDAELDDFETERLAEVSKGIHVRFLAAGRPVNLIGLHLKSERGG
ncbi:MAG: endonuclease/exonuclease/phosphatase family protein, partial [Planctomycetota bacterium]